VQQSVEKTAIFLTALGLGVLIEDDFMDERETGASRDMTGWFLFHFFRGIFTFTLSYLHLCTLNSFKYEYIQKKR